MSEVAKASMIPVVIWALLGALTGLAAVASVGLGVADSESAGVLAATFGCPVMSAGAACFLAALVSIAFNSTALRAIVPAVVGMLGGVAGGFATMMFFLVLWPMF